MSDKILYLASMDWSRLFNQTGETLQNDGKRATIVDNGDERVRVSLHSPPIKYPDGREVHYDLLIPNNLIVIAVERPVEVPDKEEAETPVERTRKREPAIPPPPNLGGRP